MREQTEMISLGAKIETKKEPQKNYVKHHIEQPKLTAGLTIGADGKMAFNPPYIETWIWIFDGEKQ